QNNGTLAIPPQGFVVVGPGNATTGTGFNDQRLNSIPNSLPAGTVCVPADGTAAAGFDGAMTYYVNYIAGPPAQWQMVNYNNTIVTSDFPGGTGITVVLRRLANPRMPLQPNPAAADFNPYVTVDYMDGIGLQNYNNNQPAVKNGGSYEFSFG